MRPGQVPCALVSQKEILHRSAKNKSPKKPNRGEVLTMDILIQSKESQVFHPVVTVHCRNSSSSTLMTLDGMDGRGCCKTSEPNHFARPMGEPLLWLGRWSSCVCPWDNPVRGSTFWGVVCAPAGDPCAPEPVKCKAIRGGVIPSTDLPLSYHLRRHVSWMWLLFILWAPGSPGTTCLFSLVLP